MSLSPLSPLRLNALMAAAPRSCTGWSCSCAAPYGFGKDRNMICLVYGPSYEADKNAIALYKRRQHAAYLRAMNTRHTSGTKAASAAKYKAMMRRHESMQKKMETLDWHLDFEDQVRTQNFFELRDRQTESDWWQQYQNEELASSARSIRNLMKDF
jgi:hypothetical protein